MTNQVIRDYLAEAEEAAKPARNLLLELARYTNYMRLVVREMLPYFPKDDPRHIGYSEAAEGIEPAHAPVVHGDTEAIAAAFAEWRRFGLTDEWLTRQIQRHSSPDEPTGQ